MRGNYILSFITIIFSLFFLFVAFQLPEANSTTVVGPTGWPVSLLVFMLGMGIVLLFQTYIQAKRHGSSGSIADDHESTDQKISANKNVKHRHLYILASIAIYVLLLPILGFVIVTPFLFFYLAWLLGLGKVLKVACISILSHIAIISLFIYVLGIPFPRGIGVFRSLSFLIY